MNLITMRLSKSLQTIAKNLSRKIEKAAGAKVGYTLIIYTPERASYVSTVDRKDSIEQMKHLIELWEKDMPDIEAHKVN